MFWIVLLLLFGSGLITPLGQFLINYIKFLYIVFVIAFIITKVQSCMEPEEKVPLTGDPILDNRTFQTLVDLYKFDKRNQSFNDNLENCAYKDKKDEDYCERLQKYRDYQQTEEYNVRVQNKIYNLVKYEKIKLPEKLEDIYYKKDSDPDSEDYKPGLLNPIYLNAIDYYIYQYR